MKDMHSLRTIADLKPGDYLCCIYETEAEYRTVLTPFLRQGLEQHEKIFYIVDAHTAETVLEYLREEGVDVDACIHCEQLSMLTSHESYIQDGVFDPDRMIATLCAETARALDEGYAALRVTGEMTWALRGLPGSERLIEYETKLNKFFPGNQCLAICQYDRRRFTPEILLDVLRTHPIVVIGTEVYENFYYIPPDQLLGGELQTVELQHWMQTLVDHKRSEEALRRSKEKYRDLVENLNDVLYSVAADGVITYVSSPVEIVLGYTPVGLIGSHFARFIHPDDLEMIRHAFEDVLLGQLYPSEYRMLAENGDYRWVSTSSRPVYEDGQVVGLQGVLRDITTRKRAEKTLQESQANLSALIENTDGNIWSVDRDYRLIVGNSVFHRNIRTTRGRPFVPGDSVLADDFPSEMLDEWRKYYDRALRGERFSVETQRRFVDMSRYMEYRFNPIHVADGSVAGVTVFGRDITERKQVEEALAVREKEYRTLVERLPDFVVRYDTDLRRVYVNPAWEEASGLSAREVINVPAADIPRVPKPTVAEYMEKLREVLETGNPQTIEFTWVNAYGVTLFLDYVIVPEYDQYGKVVGLLCVGHDLTERKRAEEALRNSQEQLALIIDTLPALIGYVDSKQRYLYVNQRYADWYGCSKDELAGKHLKEVVYEKSYQGIVKHVQAVLQGQEVSFENISYDLEGQLRAVKATYAPHFDENGQVKAFLGLVQDITEQKRAEEALRDSEERYRAIFEQAADSILLVDVETGALIEFNDRAHKNLGYTREEFEKLKISDFEVIESAEEVAKHIEKILKEGADNFETKHRTKGGEIRDILVSSRAISISGRDLAQSIWKDITDRKRAEEKLKKSLKEKEVLLQELYHRTKNNMNVIGAMLSMQAENLDDQRLTRILDEIKQRILSMAMVHEQLYDSQDLSHVNLRAYTRQLADSLLANYHIGPGNIALKVEVEPIVVLIETAIPYGLIINELMTNALKYAFPENRDGEIRIALCRLPGEKELELRFCDNGIGLPEDLDIRKTQSFGMKLITLLVDLQFKGTVDVQVNTGTEFRIRFQELNYKARV